MKRPSTVIASQEGRDPLVQEWLQLRRSDCAWRSFAPLSVLIGFLMTALCGMAFHALMTTVPENTGDLPLFVWQYLYEPALFFTGVACYLLPMLIWQHYLKASRIPSSVEQLAGAFVLILLYLALFDYLIALSVATLFLSSAYLIPGFLRLLAIVVGQRDHELQPQQGDDLPVYTILLPLYHEAAIAHQIWRNIQKLDYPKHRLDVKFLLEADDSETRAAFESLDLPEWTEIIVVPDVQPKTKPRACNHGLAKARGDYLVIYDAEDRPEPDQLRKALALFAQEPETTACVQGHLAFHNYKQNMLTQLFTQEYNAWFRHYLPGLWRLGSPIPLGGTSNHFRMEALREIGGWDPYNVTEDCDLGLRLSVHGWQTAILPSTTWEEANSQVGNWIRQRSRWIKGYMQTFFVWARRPQRLLQELGPWRTLWFLTTVAAVPVFTVLNPLMWAFLLFYLIALTHDMMQGYALWELLSTRPLLADRWSWPMLYMGIGEQFSWSIVSIVFTFVSALLLVFNGLFAFLHVYCGRRSGQRFNGLLTFFMVPFYWILMSIAAWKAAWQLVLRPHYWEKTTHGLNTSSEEFDGEQNDNGSEQEHNEDADGD